MQSTQDQVYGRWRSDPERFWAEAAEGAHWYKRWSRVLDSSRPPYPRWFSGGVVNTCYNALDRYVAAGRADQPALIYDSPVTQTIRCFTYRELLDQVSRFAGVLIRQGVGKGDRVIIYMPMVPEAAVAMLACARIGAIHSVVFGGFAAHELAARISHAEPKVIVSTSCGIELNRVVPYGVRVQFTAPTAIRAIKRDDPNGEHVRRYDLSHFRTLFLAGERCDPDTLRWAEQQLGVPVIRPLVAD